ncbi:MAG: type IV pilin N-terminal domain-containing protein [Methanoregulaceae archaeon]
MIKTRDWQSAVSPVVGVMLMLTITIILAAVVSAYVGGVGPTKTKPPQVSITGTVYNNGTILFEHMGGDGLNINDLAIVLDQGDQRLRITNRTINRSSCDMKIKGGSDFSFIRSGDTIVLSGDPGSGMTNFSVNDTSQKPISIRHKEEFTWTLLSQRCDAIIAFGRLAFY